MEECSYFVGNDLVQVRHVFLPKHLLVLSLLKPRGVGIFWEKKYGPNRGNPLNNSIDNKLHFLFVKFYTWTMIVDSLYEINLGLVSIHSLTYVLSEVKLYW